MFQEIIMPRRSGILPTVHTLLTWLCWLAMCSMAAAQPASPAALSESARTYLEGVISLAQANSINRSQIDWPGVRREALSRAAGAQDEAGTHPAVQWLVSALGDRHSAFLDPAALKALPARSAAVSGKPEARLLHDRFGFVLVPTFGSPVQASIDQFATDLHGAIGSVEASHPCGWVVDLRSNGGGNMWPMLAGVGPIIGTGRLGSFQDPDGRGATWSYQAGEAKTDSRTAAKTLRTPVTLHGEMPPVAVLIGSTTASSGEAIAIAFRGRASTRLFGAHTKGLTTSNRVFPLSDGSLLNLATAAFADRTGASYRDGVIPDEVWDASSDLAKDSLPITWLAAQQGCVADRP
ncbi:MAG: S41 family peptidase [Vicinamibacterales bacterium]